MKKLILLLFLPLILNKEAFASPKLITSVGINKINVVDENLAVPSNINYSLSYGLINAKKGFSYSLTTNRGLEQVNKSTARINSNNG